MDKKIFLVLAVIGILCLCILTCSTGAFLLYNNRSEKIGEDNQRKIDKIVDDAEDDINDIFDENSELDATYSNEDFTIDYSSNWQVDDATTNEVTFYVYDQDSIPDSATINEIFTVYLEEAGGSAITTSWCSDYYQGTIDRWTTDYPEDQIEGLSYSVETINGQNFCHSVISSVIESYPAIEHLYSVSNGSDVYTLQTYTALYSENLDLMLDAVRTFEIY